MRVSGAVSGEKSRLWRGVAKGSERAQLAENIMSLSSFFQDEEPPFAETKDFGSSLRRYTSRFEEEKIRPKTKRRPLLWLDVQVRLPLLVLVDPTAYPTLMCDLGNLVVRTEGPLQTAPTVTWLASFRGCQFYGQAKPGVRISDEARLELSSPLICECHCQQALVTRSSENLLRPAELSEWFPSRGDGLGLFIRFQLASWQLTLHPGVFLYLSRNYSATCDVPRTPPLDSLMSQPALTRPVQSPRGGTKGKACDGVEVHWNLRDVSSSKADQWGFFGVVEGLEITVVDSSSESVFKSEAKDISVAMSRDRLRVGVTRAALSEGVSGDTLRPIFQCSKDSEDLPDVLFVTQPVPIRSPQPSHVTESAKVSQLTLQQPCLYLHPKVIACAKLLLDQNVQQIVDPLVNMGGTKGTELPLVWPNALRSQQSGTDEHPAPFSKSAALKLNMLRKQFRDSFMADSLAIAPADEGVYTETDSIDALCRMLKCPLSVSTDLSTSFEVVRHSFALNVDCFSVRVTIPGADGQETGCYNYRFSTKLSALKTTVKIRSIVSSDIQEMRLKGNVECGLDFRLGLGSGRVHFQTNSSTRHVVDDFKASVDVTRGHLLTEKLLTMLLPEYSRDRSSNAGLAAMTSLLDKDALLPFILGRGRVSEVRLDVSDADLARATQAICWIEDGQPDRLSRASQHRPVLHARSHKYGHVLPVTDGQSAGLTAFTFPACTYSGDRVLAFTSESVPASRSRPSVTGTRLIYIDVEWENVVLTYFRREQTSTPLLRLKAASASFSTRTDIAGGEAVAERSSKSISFLQHSSRTRGFHSKFRGRSRWMGHLDAATRVIGVWNERRTVCAYI